jgi:conjugative relaxase-like TrwC/TraI family protein
MSSTQNIRSQRAFWKIRLAGHCTIMLTIHKVSLRKINYYLELAREDYYLRGGEPPGVWHGRGAAAYGLNGLVNHAHFRNLFAGFSPDGQTAWVQNAGQETGYHTRCPGFDLTFSPPKSVSVLWSQSPEEIRQIIEKDHLKAVQTALSMMEQFAGVTRRGQGGKIWEKARLLSRSFRPRHQPGARTTAKHPQLPFEPR